MTDYQKKILPLENEKPGSIVTTDTIRDADEEDVFGDNVEAAIAEDDPAALKRLKERV
jgi:hypothetical protein